MTEQRDFTDLQQPAPGDRDAWTRIYRSWKSETGQRSDEWEAVSRFIAWRSANPRRKDDDRIYSHDEILAGAYLRDTPKPAGPQPRADYDDSPAALGLDEYDDL